VTSIGSHVFDDCTSLTEVTIPDNVTEIPDSIFGMFKNCTSLTSIFYKGEVYADENSFYKAFYEAANENNQ